MYIVMSEMHRSMHERIWLAGVPNCLPALLAIYYHTRQ